MQQYDVSNALFCEIYVVIKVINLFFLFHIRISAYKTSTVGVSAFLKRLRLIFIGVDVALFVALVISGAFFYLDQRM